jgi:hypothetical protein
MQVSETERIPSASSIAATTLLLCLLTGFSARSGEMQPPALFLDAAPRSVNARALTPEETRSRLAVANVAALCGEQAVAARGLARRITLNLFPDAALTMVVTKTDAKSPQRIVYSGVVDGVPGSQVTLAVNGDALAAIVDAPGMGHFAIEYAGRGVHRVTQFDPALLPPAQDAHPAPRAAAPRMAPPVASRGLAIVDVMVIYTSAVKAKYQDEAGINALIDTAVADANTVLENSLVNARLNLVFHAEVDYVTSGDDLVDLQRLTNKSDGYLDQIHAWRDQYGADLVCLLNTNNRGIAWQPGQPPTSSDGDTGFSVVGDSRIKDHTYIHEAGHNFGCAHDRPNTAGNGEEGAYPYSYGYSFTANNTFYGTIMSYRGQRIPYFSTPNVTYRGVPAGQPDACDNARTINNTCAAVASYRTPSAANRAPNVSINTPAAHAEFDASASITISATAADADGSIARVEFFAGSTRIGEAVANPYTITWTNPPSGVYDLSAVATDNLGATAVSSNVTVHVASALQSAPSVVAVPQCRGRFSLTFARANRDSLSFSLTSPSAFGYADKAAFLAGTNSKSVTVYIGDVVVDALVLRDGKGAGAGKLAWNCRTGEIRYHIRAAQLAALLEPYGAVDADTVTTIAVPLAISVDGQRYGGTFDFFYKARAGRAAIGKL